VKFQIPNSKSQIPILEVKGLKVYFDTSRGLFKAVDGVSFDIERGSVFGLVGESGSGKTLTALSALRLIRPPGRIAGGEILFGGCDILKMGQDAVRAMRGARISMVFQEPLSSFNPVFTVGYQITEAILAHRPETPASIARETALEHLAKVHIADPQRVFQAYPHQLSGGIRQRAMIAASLVNSPELLILDEPTTALDVTIQAQILDLLEEIIEKEDLSVLFISHDLGIIARMCDAVAVMRSGRIVESGAKDAILTSPRDPYTTALLESVKALSWQR
jgi:ABC-type dipeptide/oligopeptide/nickel transport system ATPase component